MSPDLEICTGCGWDKHEPLGEHLACCPDSRYRSIADALAEALNESNTSLANTVEWVVQALRRRPTPSPPAAEPDLEAVYKVKGRLGAYLNTMVADLGIEGKGQYLRDLFIGWEKEMENAIRRAALPSPAAPLEADQGVAAAARKAVWTWKSLFSTVDFSDNLRPLAYALADLEDEIDRAALSTSSTAPSGLEGGVCHDCHAVRWPSLTKAGLWKCCCPGKFFVPTPSEGKEKGPGKPHPAMLALEGLTPGGSEYVGDIARCVQYVRDVIDSKHQFIIKLMREKKAREAPGEKGTEEG